MEQEKHEGEGYAEKQVSKADRPERETQSPRQERRGRKRVKKDMQGEIVLLDDDMEFVRLDDLEKTEDETTDEIQAEGEKKA